MKSKWSEKGSSEFVTRYGEQWGNDLALRTYTSRLIGAEKALVLHGGGNTSVKCDFTDVLGRSVAAIFVKASGCDLADIEPGGHAGMDLEYLRQLRRLAELCEDAMVNQLRTKMFDASAPTPSIEALMHAFISATYIDHTHADAILALTNRPDGEQVVRDALGDDVIVVEYTRPGFGLARAAADAYDASPKSRGMVLMKHGLVTWGDDARESYERTVELVSRAGKFLAKKAAKPLKPRAATPPAVAMERYLEIAPLLRGALAVPTEDPDLPYRRCVLRPLITDEVLGILDSERAKSALLTPPLTADHLIRTKPLPVWIDGLQFGDDRQMRERITATVHEYANHYDAYVERHAARLPEGLTRFDPMPRVVLLPGVGVVCAGRDAVEAGIVGDITEQTLAVKATIAASGDYEGLSEAHLFDMEYFTLQHAKLDVGDESPLRRSVGLITGAAGAIGAGICEELLKAGCHVAASDLPGDPLTSLVDTLQHTYAEKVIAVPLDVTDRDSVTNGFDRVARAWGGVDLVVANAGLAHVASLSGMDPEMFRKLERVNVEGTLHILSESARRFERQGTGGDIVVISTKNVPAPGAGFGAYSATKAAAHQLARVAGLELAEIGVRVNMVAPDAVFSHGGRRSGLWTEVGPDRMRARGLDEEGMEDYYRNRNLLKARISATHVARAVLYFATRQTPTTGATIPVDGGLPDATPR
jgi:rhamnose utilization protein RhaD (predicted bifunctional aldolase and dehydrogenase)/NAD(P)-dependent dehydrogenase (short-subunit alcohol dehydrogenase family)